jgi:hypothetical protein
MRTTILAGLAILLLLGVASCGGGGGGGSPPPTSAAEGVYQGLDSNGKTVDALVLEDGSFWVMYGVLSGNTLLVQGVAGGTSSASNGVFSASIFDFPAPGSSVVSGQVRGHYVAGSSLTGTITENGVPITFTLMVPVQVTYNYNTAASIASVSGSWSGQLLDGETATTNIAANGAVSGTSSLGCTFSGTAIPRPSGKNVFNVSITFGGSHCVAANQTVSGIALTYPLGNGMNQLLVGVVNPAHTFATAFFAQR